MSSTVPQLQETMSALLEAVHKSQVIPHNYNSIKYNIINDTIVVQVDSADVRAKLETSADHERLSRLFEQITDVKNDSQQRGWAVHDDLSTITNCLEELLQRLVCSTIIFSHVLMYTCREMLILLLVYQL